MTPYLIRTQFVDLVVKAHPEDPVPPWAPVYPCSTNKAVGELCTRGLDADDGSLLRLIEREVIPKPAADHRGYAWSAADIDRAAAAYGDERRLKPSFVAWDLWNVDPADAIQAQRRFKAENPDLSLDLAQLVINPGLPGHGIAASIQYLRPSKKYLANLYAFARRKSKKARA